MAASLPSCSGACLGLGCEQGEQLRHDDAVQARLHRAAQALQHSVRFSTTRSCSLKQVVKEVPSTDNTTFNLVLACWIAPCTCASNHSHGDNRARVLMFLPRQMRKFGNARAAEAKQAAPGTSARAPPPPLPLGTSPARCPPGRRSPRAQRQRLRRACRITTTITTIIV